MLMTGLHRQPSERIKLRHIHSAVNHYAILFQSTHKGHCCDLHNIFHNNTTCRKEKGLLINSVIISWSPPLCVRLSKFLGDQTKSCPDVSFSKTKTENKQFVNQTAIHPKELKNNYDESPWKENAQVTRGGWRQVGTCWLDCS